MTASNSGVRALAGLVLVLTTATARAEPPSQPPTEDHVEAARALYREARELRRQGKGREATEKALEAYRTAATPVTALQAGELLVESGRLVEARDIMRGVALLPVSPRESDKGRDARQQAAALAGQLDMRIPKIAFAGRPAGVDLLLDGRPVTATDATAWQGVDPGAHVVVVRNLDRPCTTVNVALSEGEERTIDLHAAAAACRPEPPPAPPAPLAAAAPSSGIATGAPPALAPTRETPAGGAPDWRWIGGAIGAAGLAAVGIGGAVALHAKSDYDSVAADCPPRGCSQTGFDVRQNARSEADTAGIVMIAGAVAVAGGVVLWILRPGRDRPDVAVGLDGVRLALPLQ
jgi:hypothetical protein